MKAGILILLAFFFTAVSYGKMVEVSSNQINCKKLVKLLKKEKVLRINDKLYSIDAAQCAKVLKTDQSKVELQSGFEIVKNNNMCSINYACDPKKE